jgi:hypothetical protein
MEYINIIKDLKVIMLYFYNKPEFFIKYKIKN